MTVLTLTRYQRPLWDEQDALFLRCLQGASALGFVALLVMLLLPNRVRPVTTVEQVSPRMARLILEPPKPKAAPAPPVRPAGEAVKVETAPPAAIPEPMPVRPRRPSAPTLAADAGRAGRERATREVAALAATSASLNSALDGLSATLGASKGPGTGSGPARPGRTRGVRAAQGAEALGGGAGGLAGGGTHTDLGGSIVAGSSISIGGLEGGSGGGGAIGDGGSGGGNAAGSGAAPGVYRSNASLLAVIQRYAAGIQYCYGNELKREPSLKGKLIVALTVAASGEVTEASIVQNSTSSARLAQCALSQIRDWRFPPIPQGVTTFQTPFVFTPPQ